MNGRTTLYIDQWGSRFCPRTVKDLRQQIGMGGNRVLVGYPWNHPDFDRYNRPSKLKETT